MAKQESLILLRGRIGNLSFYKTPHDGYLVRKKSTLNAERIKSDPAFKTTRENASEFGRAARAGKLLRRAFEPKLYNLADTRVTRRLAGAMVNVIKKDTTHLRGQRTVIDGDATLLKGFQFNRKTSLEKTFRPQFTASIDRLTGKMVVDVPAFSPDHMISAPDGATHFRLRAAGAALDFEGNSYEVATAESADLSLSNDLQEALQLSLTVTPASAHPLFLVLGIEFVEVIKSGDRSLVQDGGYNAMAILKVDTDINDEHLTDETPESETEEAPLVLADVHEDAEDEVEHEVEEEVYAFSDDAVNRFEPALSVSDAPTAMSWSYGVTPFESYACNFSGDIHQVYAYADPVPRTASTTTPKERKRRAPSRPERSPVASSATPASIHRSEHSLLPQSPGRSTIIANKVQCRVHGKGIPVQPGARAAAYLRGAHLPRSQSNDVASVSDDRPPDTQ